MTFQTVDSLPCRAPVRDGVLLQWHDEAAAAMSGKFKTKLAS